MSLRDRILGLLRVPPEPQPPPGAAPRLFRAAPNYYRLLLIRWALLQLLATIGVIAAIVSFGWIVGDRLPRPVYYLIAAGELFAIAGVVLNAAFGWLLVRYDFELRWYMVSDRAIRIREGIATIREKTIALANIQNLSIHQGPLQRLLGIADVEVRTAGGGSGSSTEGRGGKSSAEPMHVAFFRGVANAVEIRDLLLEGVRRERNTGLGDPDESPAATPGLESAVAELLAEARALGRAARA